MHKKVIGITLIASLILGMVLTAVAVNAEERNDTNVVQSCDSDFCKSPYYTYVKEALQKDKTLRSNVSTMSKKYDLDKRLFYAILITENLRMHTQFPDAFKKTFKAYKVPLLAQMSQSAYGYFGVKNDAINKMITFNKNKDYTVGENKTLNKLESIKSPAGQSKYVLGSKAVQVELTAILLKQHLNAYKNIMGMNLSEKSEILLTLYNLGAKGYDKKPHANPQSGGSYTLRFTTKCFGDAGAEIYNNY